MEELTRERINQMDSGEIYENVVSIFDCPDPVKREMVKAYMEDRARQLNITRQFKNILKAANSADRKLAKDYTDQNRSSSGPELQYNSNGNPAETIENYLAVFRADDRFRTLRFNEFSFKHEITENMHIRPWGNSDDSDALNYIEQQYHFYHVQKFQHAMRVLQKERAYHPIVEYINGLQWDGEPRVEQFLHKWMHCGDSPYSREVSRLVFAGGIHRLYDPGCKFDSVPVLIGTKQGEGKSSVVRWLAIKDEWYGELTELEGARGVENIQGMWICELGELLALQRAREVEAIKSYLSRQVDKYRVPYAERPESLPRRCIFLGTTNKERFLTDKTGNRRFMPVRVDISGYDLYKIEKDCRAYIIQCWAEAKAKYNDAMTSLVPNRALVDEIIENQQLAEEDDWREGMIRSYLESMVAPAKVCTLELWSKALRMGDLTRPSLPEATTIGLIMQKHPKWKRSIKTMYFPDYGSQRGWELVSPKETEPLDYDQEELPF